MYRVVRFSKPDFSKNPAGMSFSVKSVEALLYHAAWNIHAPIFLA